MLVTHLTQLADRLRERTKTLHVRAERTGFTAMLLRGTAEVDGYALYLANHWPVYDALERRLARHFGAPAIANLADVSVFRTASLESDLRALKGSTWRAQLPFLPEAGKYADRIDSCGDELDELLIAHVYVRYLGDLSGGQILKRLLGQTLKLGGESLRFYDFPETTDIETLRLRYRAAIDRAGASLVNVDAVLDEAEVAFELSIELSEAVARAVG